MRARVAIAVALAAIPALLPAQRTGRVGRGVPPASTRPPRPAEKPPQAPGIPERRYRSSRFSIEGYPLYSFVRIDRYVTDSAPSNWAMLGGGTRVDFRAKPSLSLTGDLTTSTLGGPFALFTGDIGARVRPQWNGHSRPYVDARVSLAYTYDSYAQLYASSIFVPPSGFNSSGRTTSTGVGALIGGGVETALSDRWGVNMGLSASHHRMLAVRVGQQRAGSSWNFNVNTVRLTFGVRYNPRRLIRE